MIEGSVQEIVTRSALYSIVLSQPFLVAAGVYPQLEKAIVQENNPLQYGEHGEAVRLLQTKLSQLSYLHEDDIDGSYDILTEYAVKKFQGDHHIDMTGYVDAKTLHKLIELDKEKKIKKLEQLSETIAPGTVSDEVKAVQETLQDFGYYNGEIDGIYGPRTKKALEMAEKIHDLELVDEIAPSSLTVLYETETETVDSVEQKAAETETNVKEIKTVPVQTGNANVIESAKSLIGTPYVWGGTTPSGFDCSGFVQYIFQAHGYTIPRTVNEIWNFTQPIEKPSIGDLVFFQTYTNGPSHLGIYLGNGDFIHAGVNNGVTISNLSESYWQERYLGAKRVNQ